MLRNTWLKRTLWAATVVGAAALLPACRHPQYGAGEARSEVRRGIDPTRDNINVPPDWAQPPAGVGGSGPLANPGDPYSRPRDVSQDQLRLKEKQAHPRYQQPPDRPYIDPWDNSENPAAVGGSGGG